MVQRHHNGAGGERAEVGNDELRAVLEQEGDSITTPDAVRAKIADRRLNAGE